MRNSDLKQREYKMVITIIKKGLGSRVIAASKKGGAEGGTIVFGRGTASRDIYERILGIGFEPEKEIVISIVREECIDSVFEKIVKGLELEKPGKGISFIMDVKKCIGVAHLLPAEGR